MKQKGQIFSLDVLISIVLIIVALGVAMRFFELKEYETKELMEQLELERVGSAASELLVNNPNLVCELTAVLTGTKLNSLSNCLNKNQQILKADLGISENSVPAQNKFDCRIEFAYDAASQLAIGDCTSVVPATAKNVFAATRKIVVTNSKQVPKNEFNNCTDSDPATNCVVFTAGTATLKVWKHE